MARTRQSFQFLGIGRNGEPGGYKHREHRAKRGRHTGYQRKRVARLIRDKKLGVISKKDID